MLKWLFKRSSRKQVNELNVNTVRIILDNLERSNGTDCKIMTDKVYKILSEFEKSKNINIDELKLLFSKSSPLREIAIANNWEEQYRHLQKQINMINNVSE
ncbi:hypothetical protein [Photobacterium sp. J15]|uniref:hypothetical protein n=1 Tax=Photobacterium sp. J15 TaxID=265901 RepID=UPI0007E3DAD4|nr:hypothetical protein [Photobacterium sp. J15]